MELGLSLGDASKPFGFLEKAREIPNKDLGFCMGLSIPPNVREDEERKQKQDHESLSLNPPIQLDLLPHTPVSRSHGFRWPPSENGSSEGGSSGQLARGLDVNRLPVADEAEDAAAVSSSPSPNSGASSFPIDFCIYGSGNGGNNKRDSLENVGNEVEAAERASSRASDDDENGIARKKLRLSKEQSAFLEESFKEHNTLNPKQKLALAKQLSLRPRQVEVWFQNRRARTKLKQTEVDCEYLKRCCETLTEENRRLHKELQELRALKSSSSNPFYMQPPATTLTMCPSCERVATTSTTSAAAASASVSAVATANSPDPSAKATGLPLTRPRFYPFFQTHQSKDS